MARVAKRYAKSLIDLSTERNELDEVHNDVLSLLKVCSTNPDFVNMLNSPVIKPATKIAVTNEILKGKVQDVTLLFFRLIIEKGRGNILHEILVAFDDQYNEIKAIHKVNLITAVPVSEEIKQALITKLKNETRLQNIELITEVRESLIGGFILEYNNYLLDATVLRNLKDIQRQFRENVYVYNIR